MMRPGADRDGQQIPSAGQSGLVLVVVLWIIVLLTVIASGFAHTMRTEAKLARNTIDHAQARHLAEAGIVRAIQAMLETTPARRWPTDGSVKRFPMAGAAVSVSVRDESGAVNLNRAPPQVLDGLLREAGVDERKRAALVDAIIDWRDQDGLRRLHGAEDPEYERSGRDYGAKDARFEAIEELQLVLGISPSLYRRLEPWITIYSGSVVNREAASREVLLALPGASPESVDAYIGRRKQAALGATRQRGGIAKFSGRQAGVYRITSAASIENGALVRVSAVVRLTPRSGAEVAVLDWKTG